MVNWFGLGTTIRIVNLALNLTNRSKLHRLPKKMYQLKKKESIILINTNPIAAMLV